MNLERGCSWAWGVDAGVGVGVSVGVWAWACMGVWAWVCMGVGIGVEVAVGVGIDMVDMDMGKGGGVEERSRVEQRSEFNIKVEFWHMMLKPSMSRDIAT
jgi:hypothetical protein